jgi:hypothetical protein
MPTKGFERIIPFTEVRGVGWFPIVEVMFIKSTGQRRPLPLLFDTGATQITLHSDWSWLFPPGQLQQLNTVGSNSPLDGRIEFLGQTIDCNILMASLPKRPWMAGLFGRECFTSFGFGFWERTHELYVTLTP